MSSSSSAYNVPLSIYRNREWLQQFTLQNPDGSAVSLLGDDLSLIVMRKSYIVLASIAPFSVDLSTGTIVFLFSDGETGTLVPSTTLDITEGAYTWQFLRRTTNNPNTDLIAAGALTVCDSPPFPVSPIPLTYE
jgi:hypothetical protein